MPSLSQTSGTRGRSAAGVPASIINSLSFLSAGKPSGRKRSPGRRPRTVRGGRTLAKSRATRPGSAPKARGSNPAGRARTRAVTAPAPGSAARPGTGSATLLSPGTGRRGAADRKRVNPDPSLWPRTPPGRSHDRAPGLPAASRVSTWRLEKSAGSRATARSAASRARESTAGCAVFRTPAPNRYRCGPAAALSSTARA